MKAALVVSAMALLALGGGLLASSRSDGCGGSGSDTSGCLSGFTLRNFALRGETLTADAAGNVFAAGSDYTPHRSREAMLNSDMVIVQLDPDAGTELRRITTGTSGWPDQLAVSPKGDGFALSCNTLWVCDLPEGSKPDLASVIVFGPDGERRWFGGIDRRDAPPDMQGRAFDLQYSTSGNVVFAHSAFAASDGTVLPEAPPPAQASAAPPLPDLPEGFIPFPRPSIAMSPDGRRIAVLLRRFSGPGEIRAVIAIFERASGKIVMRHEIRDDLGPALLWHPSKEALLVALEAPTESGAATEFRIYQTTQNHGAGDQGGA